MGGHFLYKKYNFKTEMGKAVILLDDKGERCCFLRRRKSSVVSMIGESKFIGWTRNRKIGDRWT